MSLYILVAIKKRMALTPTRVFSLYPAPTHMASAPAVVAGVVEQQQKDDDDVGRRDEQTFEDADGGQAEASTPVPLPEKISDSDDAAARRAANARPAPRLEPTGGLLSPRRQPRLVEGGHPGAHGAPQHAVRQPQQSASHATPLDHEPVRTVSKDPLASVDAILASLANEYRNPLSNREYLLIVSSAALLSIMMMVMLNGGGAARSASSLDGAPPTALAFSIHTNAAAMWRPQDDKSGRESALLPRMPLAAKTVCERVTKDNMPVAWKVAYQLSTVLHHRREQGAFDVRVLTAPQIGDELCLFVLLDQHGNELFAMNPEVIGTSESTEAMRTLPEWSCPRARDTQWHPMVVLRFYELQTRTLSRVTLTDRDAALAEYAVEVLSGRNPCPSF